MRCHFPRFPRMHLPMLLAFCLAGCHMSQQEVSQGETVDAVETRAERAYTDADIVTSCITDKHGMLWITTTQDGVYRIDPEAALRGDEHAFTNIRGRDGLTNDQAWSSMQDRDGILWFGTGGGLCRYDPKEEDYWDAFSHHPIPWDFENDLWGQLCNPNMVISIVQDREGFIWAGTCGGGVYRYDPSRVLSVEGHTPDQFLAKEGRLQSDSLHHNVVASMMSDRDGMLWFTSMTHGGISTTQPSASAVNPSFDFDHYGLDDGLGDDMVTSCMQDQAGNLWFGVLGNEGSGLIRYDGSTFTNYSEADGLCVNNVRCMHQDDDANLWLGSERGGVCIFDGTDFTAFEPGGQALEDLRFMHADPQGNMWFGGRYGKLWSWDGKRLRDFTAKGG